MRFILMMIPAAIVAFMIILYAQRKGWSLSIQKVVGWIGFILTFFLVYTISTEVDDSSSSSYSYSSSDPLLEKGKEYILQHLKSPSTAVFLSYISADDMRRQCKKKNISYKTNCDIIAHRVEATNGFGGRDNELYFVFFKDGVPVGMEAESEMSTKEEILRLISWYF